MTSLKTLAKPASTVTQANKLIEASYHLTLAEKRVLLALLAQINSHPDATALDPYTPLTVTAGGIADLIGIPTKKAYDLLAAAVERLAERWVIIDNPDPDKPQVTRTRTRWVTAIDYQPGRGELQTYFAPKIIPYLSQLSSEFTRYRLQYVASMNSVYAIRLYELLVQWQGSGEREVEVDWLKDKFQITDKYPRLFDFKKRVLQPAVDEINEHSNLWVRYGQRKSGRVVIALQFQFGVKTSAEADTAKAVTGSKAGTQRRMTRNEIERQARPGESWQQAESRLRKSR